MSARPHQTAPVSQMTDSEIDGEIRLIQHIYGQIFLEQSLHAKAMRWRDLNSERVRRLISLDGDIGRRPARYRGLP